LDRHGGAQTRFEVRAAGPDGTMHVQFDMTGREPAFERAIQVILAPSQPMARRA
jgi:hypothetical protein